MESKKSASTVSLLIRRKKEDRLEFISVLGWPFIFVRKDLHRYVVLDALGLFSKTMEYQRLPSIEGVPSELRSSIKANSDFASYTSLLSNYERTFNDFVEHASNHIQSLIPDEEALKDLLEYANIQGESNELKSHRIPAKLSLDETRSILSSLENLKKQNDIDANQLSEVRSILFDTSSQWDKGLLERESETRNHYMQRIEEIRPDVERQVSSLQSTMNRELSRIEDRFSPEISALQEKLARLEYNERRESEDNNGYVSSRTKHATHNARIELRRARKDRDEALEDIESHYNRLIRDQLDRIKNLERVRDAEIRRFEAARSQISALHGKVDRKLGKMHEKKLASLQELDRLGVLLTKALETKHQGEESFHFTLPILVARYEAQDAKTKNTTSNRWEVFPPLVLRRKSKVVDSLKKFFGGFPLPVESRSEKFEKVLAATFEKALEESKNRNLGTLVSDIASSQNLLHIEGIGEKIELGLERLRNEGWLKEKQFDQLKEDLESLIGRKLEIWKEELPVQTNASKEESAASKVVEEIPSIPNVTFVLQTKDHFGTNYSSKKWLSILDESKEIIDLKVLGNRSQNYAQVGYLNLLVALYDSKNEDYELEERIKNDSWTKYMLFFLRNLKSKGKVQYDPSGSEYSTIKPILEKMMSQGESSETTLVDGSKVIIRKLSFVDSLGNTVQLERQSQLSKSGKATAITFSPDRTKLKG